MKTLTTICLCALIWSTCPKPVPRFWFDLVIEKTGLEFDYSKQADHDTVRELLDDTIRGSCES
jgi:hypothetical protein